jgi:hypothetical protein
MTFAFAAPGWVHLFLTLGVFLLIWRIVAGGTQDAWERYQKGGAGRGAGRKQQAGSRGG